MRQTLQTNHTITTTKHEKIGKREQKNHETSSKKKMVTFMRFLTGMNKK